MTKSIMNQSTQLADYINQEQLVDLIQSLFPGREWEDLDAELHRLTDAIVPDLQVIVKSHIDSLDIPEIGGPVPGNIIRMDLGFIIAQKIDEQCPDWNIAQKSLAFWNYYTELTKQAIQDLNNRVLDKHRRMMEAKGGDGYSTPDNSSVRDGESILRGMFNKPE